MDTLTTRQRDILKILLEKNKPFSSSELAGLLNLTPRQVNYSIQGVRIWLKQHNQELRTIPGAGFAVEMPPEQASRLSQEISGHSNVQIILSVSQRLQLLALYLLSQEEPQILSQLEQKTQLSRMTITKDLDDIEAWLRTHAIILLRKPHFGIQINGSERDIQRALIEILWGEAPFSNDRIIEITHAEGLEFDLARDSKLLPFVDYAQQLLSQINIRRTIGLVAKAEEQLGGRFTDDAVLILSLAFSITALRVQKGHHLTENEQQLDWLETLPIWPVATFIAKRLGQDTNSTWKPGDVAEIAIHMIAAPRNAILNSEIERYEDFSGLIERIMDYVGKATETDKLKNDRTLKNGLLTYIVPTCYRVRFNVWFPVSLAPPSLPEQDEREAAITNEIVNLVFTYTGIKLPSVEIDSLVSLLRAAIIRNRTYRFNRIIVICPSGMATAQLLVARLNARFPYLSNLEVISLHDLSSSLVASADLILTTVPLPRRFASAKVIQVHPLLNPEDIDVITQYLS